MTFSTRPSYRRLLRGSNRIPSLLAVTLVALCACQQTAVSTPTAPPRGPGSTATSSPLAGCPSLPAPSTPQPIAQNLPAPDDLAFDNTGRLLFSDVNAGSVSAVNADGTVERLASGIVEPEGIVARPDGTLLVAEQGRNRVDLVDPQSHLVSVWRAFPNRTANAGIDGIGPIIPAPGAGGRALATPGDVIVPDSPNGVVWAVSPDGRAASRLATGMVRPVGAALDSSGRLFIPDEGGVLWVLDPARHRFASLATPDDAILTHGDQLFVTTLGDNAIHEFDAQGHQLSVLTAPHQPQGIALDGADNLYFTEFYGGRIDRLIRTFSLQRPTVTRIATGIYRVCPTIARATGFTDPLTISMASTSSVAAVQLVEPGTDSSGAIEVRTSDPSIRISVLDKTAGLSLDQSVSLAS
jgi:sugar lactone lactonase YvrE